MLFRGTYTAVPTPFDEKGNLDFDALERILQRQIEAGVDGIVLNGCTGESPLLSDDETREVIYRTVSAVDGRLSVVVGTGRNTTAETVSLSLLAQELGADAVMVITPSQVKPTQAGLRLHYLEVAEALDIPLLIYHIPGRTAARLASDTVAELARHPNIAAVKEASGSVEQVQDVLARCDITVLSGDDSLTLAMMALGAKGVVSVASNVAPRAVKQMVDFALQGDFENARRLNYILLPLFRALFAETNPIPLKAALELMGVAGGAVRPPLTRASAETVAELRVVLEDLKLL